MRGSEIYAELFRGDDGGCKMQKEKQSRREGKRNNVLIIVAWDVVLLLTAPHMRDNVGLIGS